MNKEDALDKATKEILRDDTTFNEMVTKVKAGVVPIDIFVDIAKLAMDILGAGEPQTDIIDSKMMDELLAYMEQFDHDDHSDGAWQASLQEAVEAYNQRYGTNYDPYDSFIAYVMKRASPTAA